MENPKHNPSANVVALLAGIGAILCWSVSAVLIRYTRGAFTSHFQNFFRFSIALIILWVFVYSSLGRTRIRESLASVPKIWPKLAVIAVCNYFHQLFLVEGIYRLYPAVATLLIESSVLFSAGLAFFIFRDERRLIKNILFQIGLIIAIIGMVITISGGGELKTEGFNLGALYMILSGFAWALFSVLIRLWIPKVPSALATSTVFTIVVPLFFITHLLFSGGTFIPRTSSGMWLVLTLSGVVGIGMGYTFYYKSLPDLGVTVASSIGLLGPFFTSIISFLVLGEFILFIEAVGGILLLLGCYIIIRVRFQKTAPPGKKKLPS